VPEIRATRAAGGATQTAGGRVTEAAYLQKALVELNKKGKVGTRTVTFRIGTKAVATDAAMKALAAGKKVKAVVVQFRSARGSKLTGGSYYRAKVRVSGIPIATFDNVRAFGDWAKKNVLTPNAAVARGG
jgi:predicted ABC-class ATPase